MFSFWSSSKPSSSTQEGRTDSAKSQGPSTPSPSPSSTTTSPAPSQTTRNASIQSPSPIYARPPANFHPERIFVAGLVFFTIAQAITRRSMIRRYNAIKPSYFQQSNKQSDIPVNGAMEAFEALNIATVNVISGGMMLGGGVLWGFGIHSLPELRWKVRMAMGFTEESNESAEEEFEEWLATTLARKNDKEKAKSGKEGREGN